MNGEATLTFRAGAWDGRSDATVLNLSVSNGTISTKSVTMEKAAFTDYEATITATGEVRITFAAEKGRFFLDEVLVKGDKNATGISNVNGNGNINGNGRIYTLDGRYVGTDFTRLSRGLYIVNGHKVVIK